MRGLAKICKTLSICLIMSVTSSCEDQGFLLPCKDCSSEPPVEAYIEVKIDFNTNGTTWLQIYEGNIDDNVLFGSWNASNSSAFYWSVPVNKKYTIKVTYYVPMFDDTYIAIDSLTPRVKYEHSRCGDPCYIVYDRTANLKIKYY